MLRNLGQGGSPAWKLKAPLVGDMVSVMAMGRTAGGGLATCLLTMRALESLGTGSRSMAAAGSAPEVRVTCGSSMEIKCMQAIESCCFKQP